MRIAVPGVIVLVGPSGSGKSTWALRHFSRDEIVASDDLRAVVGVDEYDQRASTDAFAILDEIVTRRVRRKLTTVIDTLGMNDDDRARWVALAGLAGLPAYAVAFATEAKVCRARNKQRLRPVPAKVLTSQINRFVEVRPHLGEEGFAAVIESSADVRVIGRSMEGAAAAGERQSADPARLEFGLQISDFGFTDGPAAIGSRLVEIAHAAERIGFSSLWVMDHMIQIPQVGPEWSDLPEAYTTLAFLAGSTRRIKLGTLVTGVGYRNPALLGKMIATLDVLSGGRALAGLGAGWFDREAAAYGWEVPTTRHRLDMLEDTLQMLPLLWGPGAPSFSGKTFEVPAAVCYPRPLQERIPILVGGGGEKRTLRLVASYADTANFMGDADTVRHKAAVLAEHCAQVGRDPAEIELTHLGPALVAADQSDLDRRLDRMRPNRLSRSQYAVTVNAGLVDDHIGRFRLLTEAGVRTAIVWIPGLADGNGLAHFGSIIDAFAE